MTTSQHDASSVVQEAVEVPTVKVLVPPMSEVTPEYIEGLVAWATTASEQVMRQSIELERMTAERDQLADQVADLQDRNRELASELDDALDIASEHALDPDHERLAVVPDRYVNGFTRAEPGRGRGR